MERKHMGKLNAATAVATLMTILVLYALGATPFIPVWAVFIGWACFFHMGGGTDPRQAFSATIQHVGLGIVAAWLSALLVLINPFRSEERRVGIEWVRRLRYRWWPVT